MTKWILGVLLACLVSMPLAAAESVNINTASAEEIAAALNGVGMSKAQKIIEYREQNGPFDHVDELVNVKGIGLRTVDKNRAVIVIVEDTAPDE